MTAAVVGVLVALILVAAHVARAREIIRGGVLLVLRARTPEWIEGIELVRAFGSLTYGVLRELEERGELERRETPGGPERGYRPRASYRWALPGGA